MLSTQQVAEIINRAIRKTCISLQLRYPFDTSFNADAIKQGQLWNLSSTCPT